MKENNRPKVGIGVMIVREGKVLLGKRKGSHGEGEYAFPGGHLEYGESFEECAVRETREECGVEIKNVRFQLLANVLTYAPKHYVQIGLIAEWENGEPSITEPEKWDLWGWYKLKDMPSPLFEMSKLGIESYKTGRMYWDIIK